MNSSKPNAELAARGAASVRHAAWALIALSVITVLVYAFRIGTNRLPHQGVRLLLTIGLAFALMHGLRWARWLTILLAFLAVLSAVQQIWAVHERPKYNILETLALLGMAFIYAWVARLMLWSPSVSEFFRSAGHGGKGAASGLSDVLDV